MLQNTIALKLETMIGKVISLIRDNFSIDVNIQDQTTEVINLHMTIEIQQITVAENATIDSKTIVISSLAEPTNGNMLCIKEGNAFYQGDIISHVANGDNWTITLDSPLDYAFTTAGGCSERSSKLNVDGSITPVEASITPSGSSDSVKWDIYGIKGQMTSASPMDDALFGSLTALANGLVIRTVDGITKNLINVKSNGDLRLHTTYLNYSTKAPAGSYGLSFEISFITDNGVAVRLNAVSADTLKSIIQDNLTGLTSFELVAKGHVVED